MRLVGFIISVYTHCVFFLQIYAFFISALDESKVGLICSVKGNIYCPCPE